MSIEKQTNVFLSERLKELVDKYADGNAKKFAIKAGIGSVTFYNYLKGRIPPADILANICESYKVSLNWLVMGIGPQLIIDQEDGRPLDPDPEIAELMEGARRVLTSGNHVAFDALERNIRYFDLAIAAEKRADEAEKEIKDMKQDMEFIKKELRRLQDENQRLDEPGEDSSSNKKIA